MSNGRLRWKPMSWQQGAYGVRRADEIGLCNSRKAAESSQ